MYSLLLFLYSLDRPPPPPSGQCDFRTIVPPRTKEGEKSNFEWQVDQAKARNKNKVVAAPARPSQSSQKSSFQEKLHSKHREQKSWPIPHSPETEVGAGQGGGDILGNF